jgi:hypothetical protein
LKQADQFVHSASVQGVRTRKIHAANVIRFGIGKLDYRAIHTEGEPAVHAEDLPHPQRIVRLISSLRYNTHYLPHLKNAIVLG